MPKKTTTKKRKAPVIEPAEPVWASVYKTAQDVWIDLLANGIIRAEVHFSGGNDEGGVDSIVLKKLNNQDTIISDNTVYDPKNAAYKIAQALSSPVHFEYGSFAGEFHVNGIVVWDCPNQEIRIEGTEETTSYEDFTRKVINWTPPEK